MDSDDDELYKAIDGGLRRTVADGLIGMQYAKAIPAIANWVQVYEKGMLRPGARNGSEAHATANEGVFVTQSESINYCLENKDVLTEAASFTAPLYCQTSILPASIGGAIYVIASSRNNQLEKAKSFLKDVYVDGGRSAAGDLRNRLIANKGSRSKLPLGYLFGITIKAYASFLNGSRPGCLKWEKGQKLPEV